MLNPAEGTFDRDWTLVDLLRHVDRSALAELLEALAGAPVAVADADGSPLLGASPAAAQHAVVLDFAPVGYVATSAPAPAARRAVTLLRLLAQAERRYLMAANLHLEAVLADYEALREKHARLEESEGRLRQLTAELEQRVTEQVKQIEHAQRQLYQAEKLAAVGSLAAGLAHEINNPLGFIKSNLETARGYLARLQAFGRTLRREAGPGAAAWQAEELDPLLEDFEALIGECLEGAGRIARIVADLKGFSNVDGPPEALADINGLIERVARVAEPRLRERAELVLALSPVPEIQCRPGPLAQALLNLLLNAAEAMETRGVIEVASGRDGDWLTVTVRDTGRGIAPEILPRIFDPFFTTKPVGQGTGLGLTVAHDAVRAHGGRIRVASEPGSGSCFTIELPIRRTP
ncbi:MAG: two-component sensor histidine kinase [Azospira oryzae]|nr:MAG: two-component sensor histidine kinase [Azospira oryzae]PZP82715.1 MAG: two-component sensor histidine kinase [Azospira oryzae]